MTEKPDEDRELEAIHEQYDIGCEMEQVWNGPVGEYMRGKLDNYERQLMEMFRVTPASEIDKIRKLQSLLEVPHFFRLWVQEAISGKAEAELRLKQEGFE